MQPPKAPLPTQVFDAKGLTHDLLRRPLGMMAEMIRDLNRSRTLAWQFTVRNLKAQYRQSIFGVFWAFIPAILTSVAFTLAGKAQVIGTTGTAIPYPAYVLLSMVIWQTFVEAMTGPVEAFTSSKTLLAKILFPREALVLGKVGEVAFNFLIKMILVVALFAWFQLPPRAEIAYALFFLFHLVLLGTVIGMLLSPLALLYQDVAKTLALASTYWFFITPVVYAVPQSGLFAEIVQRNPVTPLLVAIRDLATLGSAADLSPALTLCLGIWIGLFFAWIFLRIAIPTAIERISS